ncbi:hypothetical protein FKW77_002080 [Venturia effusa]|uniref:Uncharacterized protein n=1 Tax=Venturia effusa TaxID=50376 RepID=A0A517LMD0_9PEZI|nr:hypothetical protein FKW77_002080 [Venturia effusa]
MEQHPSDQHASAAGKDNGVNIVVVDVDWYYIPFYVMPTRTGFPLMISASGVFSTFRRDQHLQPVSILMLTGPCLFRDAL